jgi:hypothetical protein
VFASLIRTVKQNFGDAVVSVALACVVGLLGIVAWGFLTFAIYEWGQRMAGPVISASVVGGIYLVLALAIWMGTRARLNSRREQEASSYSFMEELPRLVPGQAALALAGLKEMGRFAKSSKLAPALMLAAIILLMLQRRNTQAKP